MSLNDKLNTLADYDPITQTVHGNASSVSFKTTIGANSTLYVQASVPEGKRLVVASRTIDEQEGLYFVDVCSVTSFIGGTTTGVVRRALNKGNTPVETIIRTGITPSGLEVLEYGMQDVGDIPGSGRPVSTPSIDGVIATLTGENNVIRIQRTGTGTVNLVFRLLCWEIPE